MMIGARWCGAVCHHELWKRHSSGLSKPRSGEMPTPWSVLLVLCQRGISRDRKGLNTTPVLLNLCWGMIDGGERSNSVRTCSFHFGVGSVVLTRNAFLSRLERCASRTEQPARQLSRSTGAHQAGREKASTGCWCKQPAICSCGWSSTNNTVL